MKTPQEIIAQQAETILSYQHQNSKLIDENEKLKKRVLQVEEEHMLIQNYSEDSERKVKELENRLSVFENIETCPYCRQPKSIHSPTELELCLGRLSEPEITLECPKCKKAQSTKRDYSFPIGTVLIRFLCPECNTSGEESIEYLDLYGNRLTPSPAP